MIYWCIVKFRFTGFHCWPEAPEEVVFLRNRHRHIFHCEVCIEQRHDDRDIEFFIFKKELESGIPLYIQGENDSCEMIASRIKEMVERDHPGRIVIVQVFEDNENGAMVN